MEFDCSRDLCNSSGFQVAGPSRKLGTLFDSEIKLATKDSSKSESSDEDWLFEGSG
jgi:hypothetical protein